LLQEGADNDIYTGFAQLLTSKMNLYEQAAIYITKIICVEIASVVSQSQLEMPSACLLAKVISLHFMY
jgi:hypothetical protein